MNSLSNQHGGALLEGFLVSGVLVTFMVGIPMMGSLVDLKQKTVEASRYSAWEKTVQKNSIPVNDQVDVRFFDNESAPIRTARPGDNLTGANLLWGELRHSTEAPTSSAPSGNNGGSDVVTRDRLQLYQRARVTADVNNVIVYSGEGGTGVGSIDQNLPGRVNGLMYDEAGAAISTIGSFISPDGWEDVSETNPNDDDIHVNGLSRSYVEVKVENNEIMKYTGSNCTQGGAGCVFESTSILVDGWAAGDPDQIRDRVHGFVPTNRLEQVGDIISRVSFIPMLNDLEHLEKAFGCTKLGVRPAKDPSGLPTYQEQPGDDC